MRFLWPRLPDSPHDGVLSSSKLAGAALTGDSARFAECVSSVACENHGLASKVARQRGGKKQMMVQVWEAVPNLVVGCERCVADENLRAQVRATHTKYGKHGAAGTVFHIFVDTLDE